MGRSGREDRQKLEPLFTGGLRTLLAQGGRGKNGVGG